MSSLHGVTSVVCGIALLVLSGCGGESRRTGSDAGGPDAGGPDDAGATTMEEGGTATQKPEKAAEPLTKTFSQEWTRISLKSFKLEREGETVTLTVQASAPSAGWKVEIRPLAQTEEMLAEYEVVGLPPPGPSASVIEQKTVTYNGSIGNDVQQVLVHGKGGALFPD